MMHKTHEHTEGRLKQSIEYIRTKEKEKEETLVKMIGSPH